MVESDGLQELKHEHNAKNEQERCLKVSDWKDKILIIGMNEFDNLNVDLSGLFNN